MKYSNMLVGKLKTYPTLSKFQILPAADTRTLLAAGARGETWRSEFKAFNNNLRRSDGRVGRGGERGGGNLDRVFQFKPHFENPRHGKGWPFVYLGPKVVLRNCRKEKLNSLSVCPAQDSSLVCVCVSV